MSALRQNQWLQLVAALLLGMIICLMGRFALDTILPPPTPSPQVIQTSVAQALAQTQTAQPTNTPTPAPPTATPTPSASNTPMPTATPAPGAIDNPFGFREIVELTQNGAQFTMQVIDVIRGAEANRIVRRANYFNDRPPDGMEYVLVRIWLKMTGGSGKVDMSDSDIVSASKGQIFDYWAVNVCCLKDAGYPDLDVSLITVGAEAEGWVGRPVFIDDARPMIAIWLDRFSSNIEDALFFALTP